TADSTPALLVALRINGLTNTATQDVIVTDDENPSITAPADVTTTTSADAPGDCTTTAALGTPTTGDNCGVASVTNDAPAVYPVGTTTVTWTVTDVNGLTNNATKAVTVTDGEKPTTT